MHCPRCQQVLDLTTLLNNVAEPAVRLHEAGPKATPAIKDPVLVALAYSHKDQEMLDQLETHLKLLQRQGVISTGRD